MNESVQIDLARAAPFRIGPLTVEPALRQVTAATSETLEPRVMQVLVLLAMANGSIVSRDELVRQCWEGRIVGDDSINRVVARLRRLLEIHSKDTVRIETITKVGYRLIGAVALIAAIPRPPLAIETPAHPDAPATQEPVSPNFGGNGDEPHPTRVFLSYARADRLRVAKLAEVLTAAGLSVWWDTAIEGGSAFAKDIARELAAADVVVVVWSATSVESAWVLDEAGAGRDRKRLVPVQLDATPPPLGFRQVQAVDLSGWRGRAGDPKVAALVAAIARVAGNRPVATAAPRLKSPLRFAPWLVAALVLIAALAAGWHILAPKFGAPSTPIIAVLPFTDMSGAKGKAYFAEGLAEEILDTLAQDARLKVLGGVTARAIRDNSANPDFARDKLGVTRLLEGSVRGGDGADSVKVSVRLIDTADGSEIWSQVFDRRGGYVVAVQEEVAHAVAAQLAGPLGGNAQAAAASTVKVPPAAYEKVLVAKQLLRTRQADAIQKARLLATEAVALAPDYALAFATRSNATILAVVYAGEPGTEYAAARRDAATAIKLDPTLAEGFTALGGVLQNLGDFRGSIAALKRAVALKPDDTEARLWLGRSYGISGDINRALIEFDKTVASDPLWLAPTYNLVMFSAQANQFDRARAAAKRFRVVAPDLADTYEIDATVAKFTGEYAHGLGLATAALARDPRKSTSLNEQTDLLASMFAYDRISDAGYVTLSPYVRPVYAGDLRKAATIIERNGAAAWKDPYQVKILLDALVQLDRPVDLVRAFDARFATVAAYLTAPAASPTDALNLAWAFDRVGRAGDARALRAFVRAQMARAEANGTAASLNATTWAVLLMGEGNRAGALAKLEAGVGAAWWQVCSGYPWLGDRRAFTPLNGDPRFEAVKTRCRTEINKQRKLAGMAPAALK